MSSDSNQGELLIVDGQLSGQTLIPSDTPLSRLNYFNGKFLRAEDFALEQRYQLELMRHSNRGLGSGVVYGLDTELAGGDSLRIGPGLAVEPSGNLILLPQEVTLSISALIEATQKRLQLSGGKADASAPVAGFGDCVEVVAPPSATTLDATGLYVIAVCRAEALCGQQDVFGKMCEDACVQSTDRPFRKDGLVVRALPLHLATPLPLSTSVSITGAKYLRSRVAHSWFEDERRLHPDAISGAGLKSDVWCHASLYDAACCEVPLAVIDRAGNVTHWLDPWIVRRERMDAPAKRYWQWKMRMRPWDVFLAQVLQFQCQLAHLFEDLVPNQPDPCAPQRDVLKDAADFLSNLDKAFSSRALSNVTDGASMLGLSYSKLAVMRKKLADVLGQAGAKPSPTKRVLIEGGIVELPSGGYLPVVPTSSLSVNDQVRALLGEGLDLRFCVVRPDYVAHALEEAQHMERISLLEGLDNPAQMPKVDILVPDGHIVTGPAPLDAEVYRARLSGSSEQTGGLVYRGTAREATLEQGGAALYVGGAGLSESLVAKLGLMFQPKKAVALWEVDADLTKSRFVKRDPTNTMKFETWLSDAAAEARAFVLDAGTRRTAKKKAATKPLDSFNKLDQYVEKETLDGFWLEAHSDKALRTLDAYGSTPVEARFITGQFMEGPLALALGFKGVLTATGVDDRPDGTRVLDATLAGQATIEVVREQTSAQQDTILTVTRRMTEQVRMTFSPGGVDQRAVLEFLEEKSGALVTVGKVERTSSGTPRAAQYTVSAVTKGDNGQTTDVPLLTLDLTGDADVLRPSNPNHRLAAQGLDIIYAAFDVVEPSFREDALAELFPRLPSPEDELTVQATLDWVMFHRRRDKQCTGTSAPVVVAPPRSYRVFNLVQDSVEAAEKIARVLQTPTGLARYVKMLSDGPDLVISYAGGLPTPQYDANAARQDWTLMGPGELLVSAVYGAVDEPDSNLATARMREFEHTIQSITQPVANIVRFPYAPLPAAARPPDADGVMVLVTARKPQQTTECQTVYRMMEIYDPTGGTNASRWKTLVDVLGSGNASAVSKVMTEYKIEEIGKAYFSGGTANLTGDGVDELKSGLAGFIGTHAVVWDQYSDNGRAVRLQQGRAVTNAFPGQFSNANVQEAPTQGDLIGGCPSVLIVMGYYPIT